MSWEDDFQAVRKRALAQAQATGYAQGYAEGLAEARTEGRADMIRRMHEHGCSNEYIAEGTGLSETEIAALLEIASAKAD